MNEMEREIPEKRRPQNLSKKEKGPQKKLLGLKLAIIAVGILLLLLVLFLIPIKEVKVTGNEYCSVQHIEDTVFPGKGSKRLLPVLLDRIFGSKENPAFSYECKLTSLFSVELKVKEKNPVAQISFEDRYLVLGSSKGIVLESCSKKAKKLGVLKGFTVEGYALHEPVQISAEEKEDFTKALRIAEHVKKAGYTAGVIYKAGTFTLKMKNTKVALGNAFSLREQMDELDKQLPYIQGLKGVLHLEECKPEENGGKYFFEVTP